MSAQLTDIARESTISFQSKAVNDNNFYLGKVVGIVSADIAVKYGDVYSYNTSVQSADATVPDVELLTFLIIKLLEPIDNASKYIIPFAEEWINLQTLEIINSERITTFKVYDVDSSNYQNIIDLLFTAGFKAKVESFL